MARQIRRTLPTLGARARLVLMVAVLGTAFGVFWFGDVLSADRVRSWIEAFGLLAPAAYVVVSTCLGLALVPGPLLAAASGLLFGPVVGTAVTLAATVSTAVCALLIARRVGRPGMAELEGDRVGRLGEALERNGLTAVIAARLIPGLPDGPMSYAAGLLRVRVRDIALGSLIGAAPRGFAYTALGSSIDHPTGALGLAAIGVIVVSGALGLILAHRQRRGRS